MDERQADWVIIQSSSNEAFFKEMSLLTLQGSPWPPALWQSVRPHSESPSDYSHLGLERQQRRGVYSACLG